LKVKFSRIAVVVVDEIRGGPLVLPDVAGRFAIRPKRDLGCCHYRSRRLTLSNATCYESLYAGGGNAGGAADLEDFKFTGIDKFIALSATHADRGESISGL
jgi:hypothetical protein